MRISRDDLFMKIAGTFSMRSTCVRAQVGVVIVRDRHIIAHGYNGSLPGEEHCEDVGCGGGVLQEDPTKAVHSTWRDEGLVYPQGCTRTIHAETNALVYAARHGVRTEGGQLFSTHEPCAACSKLIVLAGIQRVVFFHPYRLHEGIDILSRSGIQVKKWSP